jgi:hypothetical protein
VRHALIALFAAGCSQVFDLDVGKGPDPVADGDAPPISDGMTVDMSAKDCQNAHDEDNDRIPDVDDPCPHVAGATDSDIDDDGIPDLCDDEPGMQRIVFFESFGCPLEDWTLGDGWSVSDDSLVFAGGGSQPAARTAALPKDKTTFVITTMHLGRNGNQRHTVLLRNVDQNEVSCLVEDTVVQTLAGFATLCTPRPDCVKSQPTVLTGQGIPIKLRNTPGAQEPTVLCTFAQGLPQEITGLEGTSPNILVLEADSPVTYDSIVVMQAQ